MGRKLVNFKEEIPLYFEINKKILKKGKISF